MCSQAAPVQARREAPLASHAFPWCCTTAPPLSTPPRTRTRLPLHYHRQAASQPATAHRAAQPMMSYHDYDPVQKKKHMHSFIALVQPPYRDVEKGVPQSPLDQAGLASFLPRGGGAVCFYWFAFTPSVQGWKVSFFFPFKSRQYIFS